MKNKRTLGNFLLGLTAFIWGTAFVAQRVGMEKIEPMTFNAARMFLAFIGLSIVSLFFIKKENEKLDLLTQTEQAEYKKDTVIGGIFCGIFLAFASMFQQAGIVYTTAGKAGFITAMYILFVPVLNFCLFKRRTSFLVWIAVLMGIIGMYLLCVKEGFSLNYGDSLLIICAILFSGHILCCDHFVKLGNPVRISMIQFITAAVISTVAAFIAEMPNVDKLVSAVVPILYCGIVSGGIGYTLQMVGQRFTDPTIASLLLSLESVFALLAGVVFLREKMGMREIFGCVILFFAILIVQLPSGAEHEKRKIPM